LDALLSTVQMPGGVPVATMGLGAAGAKNAGLLAVEILGSFDSSLQEKLRDFREEQGKAVEKKAAQVERRE
jgi:phosphoribosylaminoimidazole carboxylase PurE protein